MEKKKYRYKASNRTAEPEKKEVGRPKTSFSVKQRMLLLIAWGAVCTGLYIALSKKFFITTTGVFVILFMLAFIFYFITGVKVGRLMQDGKGDSDECSKLADRGKIYLIIMIPLVFVLIFDFVYSTFKIFM